MTLWEGGLRVPCCLRWPAEIPEGSTCSEPLVSMDLLSLFLATNSSAAPDRRLDGRNPLPTLTGESKSPHDSLAFRYSKQSALRSGDWKIVRETDSSPWELYNLRQDLGETNDVADSNSEIVGRLSENFREWERGFTAPRAAR